MFDNNTEKNTKIDKLLMLVGKDDSIIKKRKFYIITRIIVAAILLAQLLVNYLTDFEISFIWIVLIITLISLIETKFFAKSRNLRDPNLSQGNMKDLKEKIKLFEKELIDRHMNSQLLYEVITASPIVIILIMMIFVEFVGHWAYFLILPAIILFIIGVIIHRKYKEQCSDDIVKFLQDNDNMISSVLEQVNISYEQYKLEVFR